MNKKYLFIIFTSFLVLLFTTKYSPIYSFNDWQDANSFETVARSVISGRVLYKDIIEQKGPILYLIYIIGEIISNKYISGIFIMEVISLSVVLVFVDKIIKLFKDYKYSYLILPIFSLMLCCSKAFVHGGSAEEFSLSFLIIGIYYFIKYLRKDLNYKEFIINGIICGIISMIKFNLIGLWFGFMAFVFFDKLIRKEYKKAILDCIYFLIAMIATIFIILIYFIYNNAVNDFIYSYFTINVGSYTGKSSNIIIRLFNALLIGVQNIFYNKLYLLLFPIFIYCFYKLFKNRRERIGYGVIIVTLFLGIYIGLRSFKYYSLPLLIFYLVIIVYVVYKYSKLLDKLILSNYRYVYIFIYIVLIAILSYNFANYRYLIGKNKSDFEQYIIADIIKKDKNDVNILNYGELDYGIYNILNIIPNCKYFHTMNIDYERLPEMYDMQNNYVKEGLVDYVIIGIKIDEEDDIINVDGLYENYDLIYNAYQMYEKHKIHFYLFKLKTSIV